jgi:Putative zinc binding domain
LSDPLPGCRSCSARELRRILSLGQSANSLLTEEQLSHPEPRYPLELAFCEKCALAQITEALPPEKLFRQYSYFSSFSDVVEIASNDGYLLQYYLRAGVPVLGVEPAVNVAREVEKRGKILGVSARHTLNSLLSKDLPQNIESEDGGRLSMSDTLSQVGVSGRL